MQEPFLLFSAYLRQHCLDQVVKGIFSALFVSSTYSVAPLLKKDSARAG